MALEVNQSRCQSGWVYESDRSLKLPWKEGLPERTRDFSFGFAVRLLDGTNCSYCTGLRKAS